MGAVLAALLGCPSRAAVPTVTEYHADYNAFGNAGAWFPAEPSACTAGAVAMTAGSSAAGDNYKFQFISVTGSEVPYDRYCVSSVTRPNGTVFTSNNQTKLLKRAGGCPPNSTLVGGQCVCSSPFVEDTAHTSCVAPPSECEKLAGKSAGNRRWDAGAGFNNRSSAPHYYCDGWNPAGGGKCVAVAGNGDAVWTFEDGHWWGTGTAVYTGATASTCDGIGGDGNTPAASTPKTPDGTPPKNPDPGTSAPAPCPTGQAAGEVNGTRVCAPTGSDTPKAAHETDTKKNPDGSTTTTDQDTRCNGVKCETDTRVCKTGTDGLQTCETTTTSSEQSGFCNKAENKGNKVCTGQGEGTPSGFGGNCDAGFIAKGDDAVLNAMAQEQYKRNCELLRTDKEPSTWLTAEGQKTGDRTGDNPNNGTVAIGPGNFDTSNALGGGGGSCNLNKTITVRGYSVALPFNVLCDPLAVLGQILVAVSMLLAARIVTRG